MINDYELIKAQLVTDIVESQGFSDQQPVKFGKPLKPIKRTHAVVLGTLDRQPTGRQVYEKYSWVIVLRFVKTELPADVETESFLFARADALLQRLAPYVEDKDSIPVSSRYAGVGGQKNVSSVNPVYDDLDDADLLISVAVEFSCSCVVYQ